MNKNERWKAEIRNYAKQCGVSPQAVLTEIMLERFLERLSLTSFRNLFIVKGGVLVESLVGISFRTTMDLDITIQNYPLDEDNLRQAITAICTVNLEDDTLFSFKRMIAVHEQDEYGGFEVSVEAQCGSIIVPLRIDLTSGDTLTPSAVDYRFSSLLSHKDILIRAYNIETLLAEKFETIITRGVGNTRSKDFYDVFIIIKMHPIDLNGFAKAAMNTFIRRETLSYLDSAFSIIESIRKDRFIAELWIRYQKMNAFARSVTFEETIEPLKGLAEAIKKERTIR